jgi:hypothetical protein
MLGKVDPSRSPPSVLSTRLTSKLKGEAGNGGRANEDGHWTAIRLVSLPWEVIWLGRAGPKLRADLLDFRPCPECVATKALHPCGTRQAYSTNQVSTVQAVSRLLSSCAKQSDAWDGETAPEPKGA